MQKNCKFLILTSLALTVIAAHARAESASTNNDLSEAITPRKVVADAGAYFTAPLRWDRENWALFGGSLAAVALAHHYDDSVRTHFTRGSSTALDGKDSKELQDYLPSAALLAGTWLYGAMADDNGGKTAAWAMTEAAGLSTVTAYIFKAAAGRQRPNQTTDANQWRKGGSSFPSLHVTAAFAIGTAFAESGSDGTRWLTRTVGYGLAGLTTYQRLKHNAHWLSDTAAAAALGAATGMFVVKRTYSSNLLSGLAVTPVDGGMMVSYQVTLP
jgi:PAP2 superfamily